MKSNSTPQRLDPDLGPRLELGLLRPVLLSIQNSPRSEIRRLLGHPPAGLVPRRADAVCVDVRDGAALDRAVLALDAWAADTAGAETDCLADDLDAFDCPVRREFGDACEAPFKDGAGEGGVCFAFPRADLGSAGFVDWWCAVC